MDRSTQMDQSRHHCNHSHHPHHSCLDLHHNRLLDTNIRRMDTKTWPSTKNTKSTKSTKKQLVINRDGERFSLNLPLGV